MRDAFVRTLTKEAANNKSIVLITGDLGFGVLNPFIEAHPNQYINAGISEQNMTGVAAGMAIEGSVVFTYSIGNFPTLRCLEQIRNDCCYNKLNVKIVCIGSGFTYGALGMSHQATEDIGVMNSLPDITIFSPCDAFESEACTELMIATPGVCYLRLGRGNGIAAHNGRIHNLQLGIPQLIKKGKDFCVFFTGDIFEEVEKAANVLEQQGISIAIYSLPVIKPLKKRLLSSIAAQYQTIVTVEEQNVNSGIGSIISNILYEEGVFRKIIKIGIQDCYCTAVGDQRYLREQYGISSKDIVKAIFEAGK